MTCTELDEATNTRIDKRGFGRCRLTQVPIDETFYEIRWAKKELIGRNKGTMSCPWRSPSSMSKNASKEHTVLESIHDVN